ncbi:MFS transporter [Streptomyces sp. NPDC058000]|uniref:MFS transporter n=1 Tax=Streptomyces sp. NPDC058000 TaxID=3346299 RepID=UPI0036EB1B0A
MTAPARPRLALAASVAGACVVALDGTVLMTAQPRLKRELAASMTQVQWASTAYLVAVAALLVVAGRLGDRYGHQRTLITGLLGFAAASAGIAVAPSIGWVIGLRALQGTFAALLQPATLALLRMTYPADRLARPVAVRTAAIGLASALGPVLGGALVAQLGWRSVFLVNVPLALGTVALCRAARIPPVTRRREEGQLDLTGAVLLALALAALVATLTEGPSRGWTAPSTLLGCTATASVAVAVVLHERRAGHPIVPRAVTRSRTVVASTTVLLLTAAGVFGTLFAATFYFQGQLGLDPLASGLRALPLTGAMLVGAPLAGAALSRIGARRTTVVGVFLTALGIAVLSALSPSSGWVGPVGFTSIGAGFAAVMVTATSTTVGDAPAHYAGAVGGLKQTANNIGSTLGIAMVAGVVPPAVAAAGTHQTDAVAAVAAVGMPMLIMAALTGAALLPALLLPSPLPSPLPALLPSQQPAPAGAGEPPVKPAWTRHSPGAAHAGARDAPQPGKHER